MSRLFRPKLLLTTLSGAALALLLASPAHAAPKDGKGHGKLEHFCQKASCTDAQKEEIKSVMKEFRTDTKSDREKIRELHHKLVAEFVKDQPNEKLMEKLYRQIDQIQANIVDRRHDMLMELHGVFTPEQRKHAAARLMHGPGQHKGKKGKGKRKGKGKGKGELKAK
jgi:Spy/CpxP family protein refolding chaperone